MKTLGNYQLALAINAARVGTRASRYAGSEQQHKQRPWTYGPHEHFTSVEHRNNLRRPQSVGEDFVRFIALLSGVQIGPAGADDGCLSVDRLTTRRMLQL